MMDNGNRIKLIWVATIVFFVGISVAGSPAAFSQQQNARANKFQLASDYMRAGQFERALPLLEDLHFQDKVNYQIFDKLRETYVGLKRFPDALLLVEERLLTDSTPALLSEKALLQYKMGQEEDAMATWSAAVALAPEDLNTYRTIYYSLYRERMFEQGIPYLLAAREQFNDPALFRSELAFSYSFTNRYEESMDEYLALLGENPNFLANVKSQVARASDNPVALESFVKSAERAVRKDPLNRALRELSAWLYMEIGDYTKALDAYRAIDQLESQNGLVLYNFAQIASNAGAYGAAADAYRDIFEKHAESTIAPNAQFGYAVMFQKQAESLGEIPVDLAGVRHESPMYDAAKESFIQFIGDHPGHVMYPQAVYFLGRLYQNVFLDFDAASLMYLELMQSFPQHQTAYHAQFELGTISLLNNDLRKARLYYSRLEQTLRTGELAEKAQFETARIDFYQGQYSSALTLLSAMNQNTTTDIANDAIELKVILRENTGPDSLNTPLTRYAKALLLERQRNPQRALQTLDSLIVEFPEHNMTDEARFMRGRVYTQLGRFEDAIAEYTEVQKDFSDSYLADRSLFAIAEIVERHFNDSEQAIALYADLLVAYPGSLLLPEVRSRIRRLRGDDV